MVELGPGGGKWRGSDYKGQQIKGIYSNVGFQEGRTDNKMYACHKNIPFHGSDDTLAALQWSRVENI